MKQSMSVKEVARALREYNPPEDHEDELAGIIRDNIDMDALMEEISKLYTDDLNRGVK